MLMQSPKRQSKAQIVARAAPMLGLDLASPISAMRDGTALRLDNWVCREGGVETRSGYVVDHTIPDDVTSLMSYPGQLFAATAAGIYADGVAAVAGVLSGDWASEIQTNPGGQWLVAVNGADGPRKYNGVLWSVAAITGVSGADLHTICLHQRRLFLAPSSGLTLWYLGVDAIEGAASPIYLDAVCRRGGNIVAIASHSPGGHRGPGEQLCVATSAGELVCYQGSDPDTPGSWSLVGVYDVPAPVSKRAFVRIGGRLALLTRSGLIPIPDVLQERQSARSVPSLSRAVDPGISGATSVIDSAAADVLIIQAGAYQWVLSDTGAWSRWTIPATAWCEHDGGLWLGTAAGQVAQYIGDADNDAPIKSYAVDSFQRFSGGANATGRRVRSQYRLPHPYRPRVELLTNYRDPPATFDAAFISSQYWYWSDVHHGMMPAPWERAVSARVQPWRSVGGRGSSYALMMGMQTLSSVTWTGYDLVLEQGGLV